MKKTLERDVQIIEEGDPIMQSLYEDQIKADANFFKTAVVTGLVSAAIITGVYLISHPEYIEAIRNYFRS